MSITKVIVADQFSEDGIQEMKRNGIEVHYDANLNGETLTKALKEIQPSILVVRSTKVTAADINANPKLQVVVRAGAGYDTIDVAHCTKQGVKVANCPGKNAHAVAELTLGLILSIDRRLAEGVQLLKEQKWNKGMFSQSVGIKGRTLGLVGFGAISQLVMARAQAFDMNIIAYDVHRNDSLQSKLGFKYATMDELLQQSDIISIHVPAMASTNNLVNKAFLSKMKPDAVLINTSRGSVVNEEQLFEHMQANKAFWYGTDVFKNEPAGTKEAPFINAIAQHPRVYGSHHVGAGTKQAEAAIGEEAVRIIKKYVSTHAIDEQNWVNKEQARL